MRSMEIRSLVKTIGHVAHSCEFGARMTAASSVRRLCLPAVCSGHTLPLLRRHNAAPSHHPQQSSELGSKFRRAFPAWTHDPVYQRGLTVKGAGPFCSVGSVRGMAGHSKWSNIKHIKAAKDNERAQVIAEFTRKVRTLIKETGQTDPKACLQLGRMVAIAKDKNIPLANIEKVINQMKNLKNCPPMIFEAKGPAGSLMLIEAVTSTPKHTRGELQGMIKKCGFSMFEDTKLARMVFEEKGVVLVSSAENTSPDLDSYVEVAIEAGAEEVTIEEDEEGEKVLQFVCEPREVYSVKKELLARELPVISAEVVYNATMHVPLDSSILDVMAKVMLKVEEHPAVLRIFTNVVEAS